MRWTPGNRGSIEDRRGSSVMRAGVPLGVGGLLVAVLVSWLTGADITEIIGDPGGGATTTSSGPLKTTPEEEKVVDFVGAVMDDLQVTWKELLPNRYEPTRAVLFRDAVESACGMGQTATGPFYCPPDRRVFLDLSFFNELHRRLGAPGDFAQAYVLAHEVGHHVQTILGADAQVREAQQRRPSDRNALSVAMELQADCYAGVWGHSARRSGRALEGKVELEGGDVEEGLNAAAAIGDDRLQKMSTGRVMPDSFTHGSSVQRVSWFRRGLEAGRPEVCDTFGASAEARRR